jgi:hypothetical protein
MKIRPEHYATLAAALDSIRPKLESAVSEYKAAGMSDMRYRWDCFRAAKINGDSTRWQCDTLYPYMDDSHCDTALRHYFRGQFGGAK